MKKLLLVPALLLGTLASADNYKYELSPMIGYNIAEGNLGIDNNGYLTGGLELQVNSADSKISPEFSLYYAPNVDYSVNGSTDVLRGAFNGVYTYDKVGAITPFAKAGLGIESFTTNKYNNDDRLFFDAGVGAKVNFTDNLALKLEAIYMLKPTASHAGNADSNLMTLVGLTYSFDAQAKKVVVSTPVVLDSDGDGIVNTKDKCPNTPAGTKVDANGCKINLDTDNDGVLNAKDKCPNTPAGTKVDANGCKINLDTDNDGVLNAKDKCPNTPAGTKVDANGCKINLDTDNDGVLNAKDKCPNTPAGTKVDANGCPATLALDIQFENNSYKVKAASFANIDKYAAFLKKYPKYSAKIVGYTDSRGAASYNKRLSEKRAKEVVKMLEAKGVSSSQLSAKGMGEANPIASNATAAGRAQNRRIEAKLTYK